MRNVQVMGRRVTVETSPDAEARSDSEARSHLKPQLLNLSTSGLVLRGVIAERNREVSSRDLDSAAVKVAKHLIVLPQGPATRLDWKHDGRRRSETFSTQAIVNPVGTFIAPRWHRDVELILIGLDHALIQRVAADMGRQTAELIPRIHIEDPVLRTIGQQLNGEFERDVPADLFYAQSLSHALVAHLLRHHSVSGARAPRTRAGLPPVALARSLDYIDAHLDQSMTLEDLASAAGFSASHFTTLFRRATRLAPHQYVMERRVERARVLLADRTLSIADVAHRTGFADQSHLTRIFKRLTGQTPRMARAAGAAKP